MLMLAIDMLMELLFNTANSLSGYMLGTKVLGWPEPAAFLLAATFGIAGMANHWRALRKAGPAVLPALLLVLTGCSTLPVLPGTEKAQMDLAAFTRNDITKAIARNEKATDAGAPYRLRCYHTLAKHVVDPVPGQSIEPPAGVVDGYELAAQVDAKARSGVSIVPEDVKADCAYIEAQLLRFAARVGVKVAPVPGVGAIGDLIR